MMAVPAELPLTTPPLVTEAVAAELLLHVPPLLVLVNEMVDPIQTFDEPLIVPAAVAPVMVKPRVVEAAPQLLLKAYFTLKLPVALPVTTPDVFTVARPVLVTDQTPPADEIDMFVEAPIFNDETPMIEPNVVGVAITITLSVLDWEPHAF